MWVTNQCGTSEILQWSRSSEKIPSFPMRPSSMRVKAFKFTMLVLVPIHYSLIVKGKMIDFAESQVRVAEIGVWMRMCSFERSMSRMNMRNWRLSELSDLLRRGRQRFFAQVYFGGHWKSECTRNTGTLRRRQEETEHAKHVSSASAITPRPNRHISLLHSEPRSFPGYYCTIKLLLF